MHLYTSYANVKNFRPNASKLNSQKEIRGVKFVNPGADRAFVLKHSVRLWASQLPRALWFMQMLWLYSKKVTVLPRKNFLYFENLEKYRLLWHGKLKKVLEWNLGSRTIFLSFFLLFAFGKILIPSGFPVLSLAHPASTISAALYSVESWAPAGKVGEEEKKKNKKNDNYVLPITAGQGHLNFLYPYLKCLIWLQSDMRRIN